MIIAVFNRSKITKTDKKSEQYTIKYDIVKELMAKRERKVNCADSNDRNEDSYSVGEVKNLKVFNKNS